MVRDRERPAPPEGDFTRAVLEAAIAALPALFRVDGAAVLLPSAERNALRGVARRNLTEPQVQALAELLMHREVAALLAEGRPFLPRGGEGLSPELQERLHADGWPDLLAVPLPGTGRPFGALVLVPEGEGRWQPGRVEAAVQLGALLAAALRAAVRATEGERRRRQTATLLERLPLVPDRATGVEEALGRVVAGIGDALGLTHCLGLLLHPELFVEFSRPGATPIGPPHAPEQHPLWGLLATGGFWAYDEGEASPADRSATSAVLGGVHPRALLAVPVRHGHDMTGALLLVQADRRRRFTDGERQFAQAGALELARILDIPAVEQEPSDRLAPLAAVLRAQSALAEAGEPGDVRGALLGALREAGGAVDLLLLAHYDAGERRIVLLAGEAEGARLPIRDAPPAPLGEDLLSESLREGHAAGGPASRALPRPWRALFRPVRAAQAFAVSARGGSKERCAALVIGTEAALAAAAPLMRALMPTAGLSLTRAALVEQSGRRERRLAALNDLLLITSAAADVQAACRQVAAAIGRDLPDIDVVNVWLVDEAAGELRRVSSTSEALSETLLAERLPLDDETGVARAVQRGATAVWQRADRRLPARVHELMERTGLETVAAVPMRTVQRVVGALNLGSLRRRSYQGEELTFLEALAGQLGGQLDLVQARQETEAERRRLVSTVATLPEGLFVLDRDGRVDLSNPVAERLLGSRPGRTLAEIFDGLRLLDAEGRSYVWEQSPFARALAGETVTGAEVRLVGADEAETPLLVNCRPLQDAEGVPAGAICLFQDLTPFRELSSLKSDFINTVSHELRTPITTIRGGALTLLKRRQFLDEQTQNELLNDIAEESERLHLLVEDLLSLTRSHSGMNVAPEPVLIGRLINRVILELGGRVGGHALLVNVPAELPPVDADPALTQKVVRNLLENAVKFSPRGQQVEVTAATEDGTVVVSVLDRGSGVPAEELDRVFEPFYRPGETVRSGTQGAGLGLAVCRRLVEMQGGRIWAEARVGGGAAFRFTLPVAEE